MGCEMGIRLKMRYHEVVVQGRDDNKTNAAPSDARWIWKRQ